MYGARNFDAPRAPFRRIRRSAPPYPVHSTTRPARPRTDKLFPSPHPSRQICYEPHLVRANSRNFLFDRICTSFLSTRAFTNVIHRKNGTEIYVSHHRFISNSEPKKTYRVFGKGGAKRRSRKRKKM